MLSNYLAESDEQINLFLSNKELLKLTLVATLNPDPNVQVESLMCITNIITTARDDEILLSFLSKEVIETIFTAAKDLLSTSKLALGEVL